MMTRHVLLLGCTLFVTACASDPEPAPAPRPASAAATSTTVPSDEPHSIVIKGTKDAPPPPNDDDEKRKEEIARLEREAKESQGGDNGKALAFGKAKGPPATADSKRGNWTVFDAPEGTAIDMIDLKEITSTIETQTVNRGKWKHVNYRKTSGWIHATSPVGPHLTQTGAPVILYDSGGITQTGTGDPGAPVRVLDTVHHHGAWWYHVSTSNADGWTKDATP